MNTDTKELLIEYRRLYLTDKKAASAFREAHHDNELFISLLELRDKVVPAMTKSLNSRSESVAAARREEDPVIRNAMLASVIEEVKEEVLNQLKLEETSHEN